MGLIDLAVRTVGGSVVAASDETFAEKENLVTAAAPTHAARTFGHRGQVYDGWETRRRRGARFDPDGDDWAVVRLGLPGLVHAVVVDTAFFIGNHPTAARVETAWFEGHPDVATACAGPWEPLLSGSLAGDAEYPLPADPPRAATHVRLRIHPDGGVARLRVLGEALPDVRRWRDLGVDLAGLANGGRVLDASDRHFSPPENLLLPGSAAHIGEGWETRRRRDDGHDWVDVGLGAAGRVHQIVVDTTHYVGNAPGAVRLVTPSGDELLGLTPLQPDTEHWFTADPSLVVDRVRVESHPDGGFGRLRLWGRPTPEAVAAVGLRRFDAVPAVVASEVLLGCCSASSWVASLVAGRPWGSLDTLVDASTKALLALDDAGLAEALAGHARIGSPADPLGAREQSGVSASDLSALAAGNRAYEERFGHVYLVRAAGRSGPELLALLRARLENSASEEAGVVRRELADITERRLRDLWVP